MRHDNVLERFENGALYERQIISMDDSDDDPGVNLDAMIEKMLENLPSVVVAGDYDDLVPLIADELGALHPLFANQQIPDLPICASPYTFKKERLPLSFFTVDGRIIHIVVYDKLIGEPVAVLAYRAIEYVPECWELIRKIALPITKIPAFVALARMIQHSPLELFFETNSSRAPQ